MSDLLAAPRSLYVHIPFCGSKCFYCDFTSYVAHESVRSAYTQHLMTELRMLRDAQFGVGTRPPLETVFVGGGTPTLLSRDDWARLGDAIHALFSIDASTEWTCEANPGSADGALLRDLVALGVNRLSVGAQTFNETLLQAIGRLHGASDVLKTVTLAREAGLRRVNLDLMLGLPDQTLADVAQALEAVVSTGVTHVSAYGLKVEEGTQFGKWEKAGLLTLPDEDLEVSMYDMVRDVLASHGLAQYEISNFAVPGQEARHNLVYWHNKPYLAAGAGAHGYVAGVRYENVKGLSNYAEVLAKGHLPRIQETPVSAQEAMEDTMMLGLRLASGVTFDAFYARHGYSMRDVFGSVMDRLAARGLVVVDAQRVVIPEEHYEIANEIFAAFIGECARVS